VRTSDTDLLHSSGAQQQPAVTMDEARVRMNAVRRQELQPSSEKRRSRKAVSPSSHPLRSHIALLSCVSDGAP
jgi:hypothetical protein